MVIGGTEVPDDYDRACAVEGLAAVVPMGGGRGARALVPADEPAAAERVLADGSLVWEERGTWTTDGPAVLMDSAMAGADLAAECPCPGDGPPDRAPVPCPPAAGRSAPFTPGPTGTPGSVRSNFCR